MSDIPVPLRTGTEILFSFRSSGTASPVPDTHVEELNARNTEMAEGLNQSKAKLSPRLQIIIVPSNKLLCVVVPVEAL